LTLEMASPALLGVPAGHALDALVFSSPGAALDEVFVAGERVVARGQATGNPRSGVLQPRLTQGFARAMQELWAG
jgi:formimidoylglutamate deiminase